MKRLLLFLYFTLMLMPLSAQMRGVVVDADDGYAVPYANVTYKDLRQSVQCDADGHFTIAYKAGHKLTISSVGYTSQTITIKSQQDSIVVRLRAASQNLGEVTVKSHRKKYRKKDNPAVELMRRVIERKKATDLSLHPFYQYQKYQKLTLSENNIDTVKHQRKPWYLQQVESSPMDNKIILPISVDETVTRFQYRKDPKKEQTVLLGKRSSGINKIFQTGEMLNTMLKEVFQDVNINDDYVRLMQYPFPSPIGKSAISFYHYFIQDTVKFEGDSCYHVLFYPANQQDFGFKGSMYIIKDSSLQVKHCVLDIPKKSDVNFVDEMRIEQDFTRMPSGEWVLTRDDMMANMKLLPMMPQMLVVRNTRLDNYSFDSIPPRELRGKATYKEEPSSRIRGEHFWQNERRVELTSGEANMDYFVYRLTTSKNFGWLQFGLKMLVENFVETSKPGNKSKFDIGPVNTLVSRNFVDGLRLRLNGRTMAALNPHLFWKGFGAYGTKSHKWYYGSEITYAFNEKDNSPFEYPMRNLTLEVYKDLMSPADKYLSNNKDNVFESFRTQEVKQMYFYNRQMLSYTYESDWGLSYKASFKTESNEVAGTLHFIPVNGADEVFKIRTTEFSGTLRYCPNQTYINTKQRRWPVNLDSPEFELTHTIGLNHFLGGQYNSNMTEARLYKRFWLGSWGYVNTHLVGRAQWNKVPFPLLCMPPVCLTYMMDMGDETFNLMRNMEFLNDRYVMWCALWDLNGKVFNRIPLLKKLKWREFIAIKGMWGHLTDKNNPTLHPDDPMLFKLPEESHVMTNQPYWEATFGIHNIFKFFGVDYVRRLTYRDLPSVKKWGIRFNFMMTF